MVIRRNTLLNFNGIVLNDGENTMSKKRKGNNTMYLSCVYMLRLARSMLHASIFRCSERVVSPLTVILTIKSRISKKKLIAIPSKMPPLNNCVIL